MFGRESDNTRYNEILGVPKSASQDDLKKAYRKTSIKNHPDKGDDPEKPTIEKTSSSQAQASGYASEGSDGYETASETNLNDVAEKDEGKQEKDDRLDRNQFNDFGYRIGHESPETAAATATGTAEAVDSSIGVSEEDQRQSQIQLENALARAHDEKLEGNNLFKDGLYEEALSRYELALQISPDVPSSAELRSVCHANRAACFSKLGKNAETVKECSKALELNPTYTKALLRRAEAQEKLEHYDEAIADMTKMLELEPSHYQAKRTITRLKPLAEEKREKMKEDMIGKLKEMGNSILGRFGMSVDNFKAVKDPNTGSYSIQFQR